MKTSLNLLLFLLLILNSFSIKAQNEESEGILFFCRANAGMKNIVPMNDQVIIRPEKSDFLVLAKPNGLISDTLQLKKEWGFVMSIIATSDSTFSVALGKHGLKVLISNNQFSIQEEIPSHFLINEYETGLKIPVRDYVIGMTPNKNAPRKHSIYQFALIHKKDSQLLILNEPLPLESRYYQGMSNLADYYVTDNNLIINHSEANSFIVHDFKNKKTTIKQFPAIEDKNKEAWYAIVDHSNSDIFFIRNRKKEINEVCSYNLEANELQYIASTNQHILGVNRSRAFYREMDEEGDICFYFIDLMQKKGSKSEILKLDEITVKGN